LGGAKQNPTPALILLGFAMLHPTYEIPMILGVLSVNQLEHLILYAA
jgi:hypothetical protein